MHTHIHAHTHTHTQTHTRTPQAQLHAVTMCGHMTLVKRIQWSWDRPHSQMLLIMKDELTNI